METIIIENIDKNTLDRVIAFLNDVNVPYKLKSKKKNPSNYNPEFVKLVLASANEKGGKEINPDKLWESIKS